MNLMPETCQPIKLMEKENVVRSNDRVGLMCRGQRITIGPGSHLPGLPLNGVTSRPES